MGGNSEKKEDATPIKINGTPENAERSDVSKDKGKGKETSMLDRIRSSGRAATDALTSTDTNLHGLSASFTKAGQAGSTSSTTTSHVFQSASMSRSSRHMPAVNDGTFRQPPVSSGSAAGFDEFLGQAEVPTLQSQATKDLVGGDEVKKYESSDGAAVVDLLSQPPSFEDEQVPDDEDSSAKQEDFDKLRKALFESSGNKPFWDNLLDFTPQFLSESHDQTGQVESHFGTADIAEARSMWLAQWQGVLSNYTAEVWGDLEPLAAQAKREVEASLRGSKSVGDASGGGALERLRMLLAHVRGPG